LEARVELQWVLANYGRRFPLMEAGAASRLVYGVYLIYPDRDLQRPLLIDCGHVGEHLRMASCDPDLMICSVLGVLLATWATVPEQYVQGVRNFLVDALDPIIRPSGGSAFWSIEVNLPPLSRSCA
jgi:hypothetical protein